jgi:hypothetical protein
MTAMRRERSWIFVAAFLSISSATCAQPERWQQKVEYAMEIDFDAARHRFSGKQRLVYHNNSPDTLHKVFYHLYFNAFQPGSMMDVRSQQIPDPDPRVGSRIADLKSHETGYHTIISLLQNGEKVNFEVAGTILEVTLHSPIMPLSKTVFEMVFDSQVPVQIRRSGRNNSEGIAYSMAQWYPKMCEYDYQGWHANPYIGREFYGVWGDFDVKITIDRNFVLGATGYLQNAQEIGHGYEEKDLPAGVPDTDRLTWNFSAPNVHDFVWAADTGYTHTSFKRKDGVVMRFFYKPETASEEAWKQLPAIMDKVFDYANVHFGEYPYKQFSFIQGGDGGMEYPMATLISGDLSPGGLASVSIHELMHSWYHGVLANNESLYAWMDEGFTEYAEGRIKNYLSRIGLYPGRGQDNPMQGNYRGYYNLVTNRLEEPSSTHADHFLTNYAYGQSAYNKGAVFLHQLSYIIGQENLDIGLRRYYHTWKFKHPNPNDFIRIMEKVSGLELDWYKEYWINTTHVIDYEISSVEAWTRDSTRITLRRVQAMPMPIDLEVVYEDGSSELFNIPLRIMRGHKPQEDPAVKFTVLEDWPWTHPEYEFRIPVRLRRIQSVRIDPSGRLADINQENNVYQKKSPNE